jgi:hypothetical protein
VSKKFSGKDDVKNSNVFSTYYMNIGVREGGGGGGLQPPQIFENLSIRAKIVLSFGQRRSGD